MVYMVLFVGAWRAASPQLFINSTNVVTVPVVGGVYVLSVFFEIFRLL